MTIRLEMAMAYIDQQEVIDVLRSIDDLALVERLERCMTAHQQRHNGSGWPFSCRSVACIWCRRSMIRGWWNGMCHWAAEATMSSLVIIPIDCSPELPDAVRRLRRRLRDVRDRTARRRRRWRSVSFAGIGGSDHRAMVMVSHEGVDRHEVQDVLRRRWPDIVVKGLEQEVPTVAMMAEDAADLGRCRRGVEPLRVVIMPQQDRQAIISPIVEPMPVVI